MTDVPETIFVAEFDVTLPIEPQLETVRAALLLAKEKLDEARDEQEQ